MTALPDLGPDISPNHLLGEGQSGLVYSVRDESGRHRALKLARTPELNDTIRREHRVLSSLSHDGLPQVDQLIETGGRAGFLMELLEGIELPEWVRAGDTEAPGAGRQQLPMAFGQRLDRQGKSVFQGLGPAGLERTRGALTQLIDILQSAHHQGVVHCDLNRSNVRVLPSGRMVLLDFGLAATQDQDLPGELVGTTVFMAPEQHDRAALSGAVDWYALGTLIFIALTGSPPFSGTAYEVLLRKRTVSPPRPSLVVRHVADDLDDACVGLLHPNPTRRWTGERVLERLLPA